MIVTALLLGVAGPRRAFARRVELSRVPGVGAFFDPAGAASSLVPGGSPENPVHAKLVGPVAVENPIFSAMSLVVGAGIGYALAKAT